ncbi:MAG: c-type cytochrome [Planctomycetaceae bacterium]|jgi:putative heme-binding domain-containing protein|nr:c-type cytochrome [Planctomycetaceae bacterium]MBT6497645.1 c-type cytochrome [Planctomycetaceae bacterium]
MFRQLGCLFGIVTLCTTQVGIAANEVAAPEWIWASPARTVAQQPCLFANFEVTGRVRSARLSGAVDYAHAIVYVNGHRVGSREPYGTQLETDVSEKLKPGKNTVGICCRSVDGPAAVFLRLDLELEDGRKQTVVTDSRWRSVVIGGDRLDWPSLKAAKLLPVTTFGRVARFPWGETTDTVTVRPLDDYTQWKQAEGTAAGTDPATFQLPPGFEIELLRSSKQGEDSWVAMSFDRKGRLVVAKEKQGLLRFTLPQSNTEQMQVETINEKLRECRGLLFAHDSLYAMANNDKGLYRLRDTNGDDQFDEVRLLKTFDGSVGHGRNQLVLGPDGMIYAIFGDSVVEPQDAKHLPKSLAHPTSAETTQSGFLARTDSEGKNWEIVVRGLRNPFGIAFNADGEPFTYDADAEYDMGAPWYRPTRVDHLISGSDFGWRRVTKQWPPYVPDRADIPQPTLDIGKGSPTAVAFGTGSNFPAPYRDALFVLDWAYGRILAVHLSPRGSSYAAKAESFVRGRPANVTDIEFGPDGAMYFVTGGRGTQSALYRVRYAGPAVQPPALTRQQRERDNHAANARKQRQSLEAFHGRLHSEAIAQAWPHLGSDDPWIRHAARVAVEWQPVSQWQQRAIAAERLWTSLNSLLALVRVGPSDAHALIIERLYGLSFDRLADRQKLAVLFIYERCLTTADGSAKYHNSIIRHVNPHYPDRSSEMNRRLSLLLKRLDAPRFVERTIPLLQRAESQQERMHYLFVLRNVKIGWTPETRRTYFENLRQFDEFVGGDGMPTFRQLIETEALASLSAAERKTYEKLLRATAEPWLAEIPTEQQPFVRKWATADLSESLNKLKSGRNFANGKRMFATAKCIACHRIGNRGGVVGPDLSAVSARFRPADVLVSMLDPSRVVAEKYRNEIFVLKDGRTVTGRLVPGGDYRSPSLRVLADPLKPAEFVEFAKSAVELHKFSPVSSMPNNLLDHLTKQQILDLLAYINAAGRAEHPSFRAR